MNLVFRNTCLVLITLIAVKLPRLRQNDFT